MRLSAVARVERGGALVSDDGQVGKVPRGGAPAKGVDLAGGDRSMRSWSWQRKAGDVELMRVPVVRAMSIVRPRRRSGTRRCLWMMAGGGWRLGGDQVGLKQ
jgi:hypothetical protein